VSGTGSAEPRTHAHNIRGKAPRMHMQCHMVPTQTQTQTHSGDDHSCRQLQSAAGYPPIPWSVNEGHMIQQNTCDMMVSNSADGISFIARWHRSLRPCLPRLGSCPWWAIRNCHAFVITPERERESMIRAQCTLSSLLYSYNPPTVCDACNYTWPF